MPVRTTGSSHTESHARATSDDRGRRHEWRLPRPAPGTEVGEGANAVIFAERRAARFEKRFGRDHQDVHRARNFLTKT